MKYDLLSIDQLQAWAQLNGIILNNLAITSNVTKDGVDKGAGLVATTNVSGGSVRQEVLITVPADLVLSKETVHLCAKADLRLKEILDAVGSFAEVAHVPFEAMHKQDILSANVIITQSPRRAILVFLLFQLARSSPDLTAGTPQGVASPFADYIKFLPKIIPLPTFYTAGERDLLVGTSLRDALDQKLASLDREFEELRLATSHVEWCQKAWWDDEDGIVHLADWKLVDAMYRSRALDLPSIGHAMVPVIDMANHVSDSKRNARFEVDADGNVLLVKEDGIGIGVDEEINITYGAGGACETIFSYGFLDEGATSARELFLTLDIPLDDPLRVAKRVAAQEAPGVRLFVDSGGTIQWEGALVWWAVVNEEDGLDFQMIQSQDGTRELKTLWRNEVFLPTDFRDRIAADDRFDIFHLRATILVQQRVEAQGAELTASQEDFENASQRAAPSVRNVLNKLRNLELDLLTDAHGALENKKATLLASDTVVRYLHSMSTNQDDEGGSENTGDMEDDFS